MAVPPDPVLRAAVRWLEHLPASGAARCRALFTAHRSFSDVTPTQYETAYTWLGQTGLLTDVHSPLPPGRRVYGAAIAASGAPWFPDADLLIAGPADLPADAERAAAALDLDEREAYAELTAVWGKFDTVRREAVGTAGELLLFELLRNSLTVPVEHVAAHSDGYGYDIAIGLGNGAQHLEVKSTTRCGRLTIYLSRNEYETMRRDPAWHLVALRLTDSLDECVALATLPSAWIASQVPADRTAQGRWESCALEVPPNVLQPGIPVLAPYATASWGLLLGSSPQWPG